LAGELRKAPDFIEQTRTVNNLRIRVNMFCSPPDTTCSKNSRHSLFENTLAGIVAGCGKSGLLFNSQVVDG
jgi:hypothetical protein